jgi:SAM-dependent methyltransferase
MKFLLKPFHHLYFVGSRTADERKCKNALSAFFENKIVLTGIFRGMKYPDFISAGSTLFPKLLGSYEKELEPLFLNIKDVQYTEILDIGCAEGYYAIGLALRYPNAKIYGYDIDAAALRCAAKMAHINEVQDRIILKKECTSEELRHFRFNGRSFILSDCEGYERFLFTPDNIGNLSNADVLVEVHDSIEEDVYTYLISIFCKTHRYLEFKSNSDMEKVRIYKYLELDNLSRDLKYAILREGRRQQSWLFFTPK